MLSDRDRVKLLFGPYGMPPLKRGDRTWCLYRDCPVVVIGIHDAPIPWPRCRPLHARGGGKGLLVDDELARAIRHESVLAIRYWWGVSRNVVTRWRQALGVKLMDSEGTRRLKRAAIQAGIAGRHKGKLKRRLRKTVSLDGEQGLLWTAEEQALLGVLPDKEVARRTRRSRTAVMVKRRKLGRPAVANPRHWKRHEIALLGTAPDREVAARLGRSQSAVEHKRERLGIPCVRPEP